MWPETGVPRSRQMWVSLERLTSEAEQFQEPVKETHRQRRPIRPKQIEADSLAACVEGHPDPVVIPNPSLNFESFRVTIG